MRVHISPQIIVNISSLYDDVNRIFLEYIDNSLDSAEELYDSSKNSYKRPVKIELNLKGNRNSNGKVVISDNCLGIKNLDDVCGNIGNSNKKEQAFLNGQFGYGIFSFMAACNNLEVISKIDDRDAYKMVIPKERFKTEKIEDVRIEDKSKATLSTNTGTRIELTGFDKNSWKFIDVDKIISEIEKHFEQLITRKNLEISIIQNNRKHTCKSFNYDEIEGPVWEKSINKISAGKGNKKHTIVLKRPINIFLKLAENKKLDRFPIFIKNGRRIDEVKNISGFKSKHKSDLWGYPKLTGYIDVGNTLDPNIARKGFRNNQKSTAVFSTLMDIEDDVWEFIDLLNQEQSERHYNKLEDFLNKALSNLAKIDNMNFRKEFLKGGDESLSGGGSGSDREIIEGGAKDFGAQEGTGQNGDGFGNNEGEGFKFGDLIDDNNSIGDNKGDGPSNNDDGFMDDNDFKGRSKKRSGFNVKLVQREPDTNQRDQLVRSQIIGGDIEVFIKHPDFESRVDKKRNGEEKISQRLITYIAGEITVHYKDAFYEKTKINNEYSKYQLEELVEFIYKFEDLLKDLRNKNLSDITTE